MFISVFKIFTCSRVIPLIILSELSIFLLSTTLLYFLLEEKALLYHHRDIPLFLIKFMLALEFYKFIQGFIFYQEVVIASYFYDVISHNIQFCREDLCCPP